VVGFDADGPEPATVVDVDAAETAPVDQKNEPQQSAAADLAEGGPGLASDLEASVAAAADLTAAPPTLDAFETVPDVNETALTTDTAVAPVEDLVAAAFDGLAMNPPPQPEPEPAAATDLVVASEAATEPAAMPAEPDAPATPAAPKEDVLGDLESWLSTLHDRTTE